MKLRYGYLVSGIVTGLIILFGFIWSLPDGRLHVVFCDVGQGDAAYIRFPDGRDMLMDGGPDDAVLLCLGRHMPFWDRNLDIVALSHPQKDHMQGLISVLERFRVGYFFKSAVSSDTDGYRKLTDLLLQKHIDTRLMTAGDRIDIGETSLSVLWPSEMQIAKAGAGAAVAQTATNVLGAAAGELNDYSLVVYLRYRAFDGLFPGDADSHAEGQYIKLQGLQNPIELLKVPHHGSKTGMTQEFLAWAAPELAVVSVGKNSYGHPSKEAVDMLQSIDSRVLRTDTGGDIEVVSDGTNWTVVTAKKR